MLDPTYSEAERRGNRVRIHVAAPDAGSVGDGWLAIARTADGEQLRDEEHGWVGEGDDMYEAFRSLQTSLDPRTYVRSCGSCCFFQVTGMSRQMGNGAGYCLVYFPSHGRTLNDVVSVFDYCNRFVHCPDGGSDTARMRLWEEASRPAATDPEDNDDR